MTRYSLRFNNIRLFLIAGIIIFAGSCSSSPGEDQSKAVQAEEETSVGPIKSVTISEIIDQDLASKGEGIFESKCAACHKFDERYVGPSLAGLTERRDPAWIMNMIIAPEEMTQHDPVAGQLLAEYMTQMANQNISEADARALLEYFRFIDTNLITNL